MLIALLTGLNERRREMAVLRSVGARPAHVFALILGEAGVLTLLGLLVGLVGLYVGLALGGDWLATKYGLHVAATPPSPYELGLLAVLFCCGVLVGAIPAYRSYRHSLADGMTLRL
jgi:putative ABC transport system permease protein